MNARMSVDAFRAKYTQTPALLIAGRDPAWTPREPVLDTRPKLYAVGTRPHRGSTTRRRPNPYGGTCPVCGDSWTGRNRDQVTCSKRCSGVTKRGPHPTTRAGRIAARVNP